MTKEQVNDNFKEENEFLKAENAKLREEVKAKSSDFEEISATLKNINYINDNLKDEIGFLKVEEMKLLKLRMVGERLVKIFDEGGDGSDYAAVAEATRSVLKGDSNAS